LAGAVLVALTAEWWLLLVGVACIAAGWLYTGGPRPYGYAGLGEVFVFVFFGLVPVVGTAYVQTLAITATDIVTSIGVGLLACAILVTNNLRDIAGDRAAGKVTLAVRLGDPRTRSLYTAMVGVAVILPAVVAAMTSPWVALACLTAAMAVRPVRIVRGGALGPALIPALKLTGLLLLVYGLALGLVLGLT
jgi:1,4-dihydroxy-2-naphthoate octaprenyltransferase